MLQSYRTYSKRFFKYGESQQQANNFYGGIAQLAFLQPK